MTRWFTEVKAGFGPKVFLPEGTSRSDWIDISQARDTWATYFDPRSGTTIRCEGYYQQACAEAGLAVPSAIRVAATSVQADLPAAPSGLHQATGEGEGDTSVDKPH